MKTSSKILVGVSGALAAAFVVKTFIDRENYGISSAPFELAVSVNALMLLLPASVFCAAALFSERKFRVMAGFAVSFAAIAVWRFALQMSDQMGVSNSLIISSPYIAAAVIFAAFMIVLMVKNGGEKTSARILLGVSGAITVLFVVMCLNQILDRRGIDNIMQLFAGIFFYALFLLPPAAIIAAAALFLRGKTILLIIGAVLNVLLAALMIFLKVLWILTVPALASAAVCTVFAINSKKRGKE